MIYFSDDGNHLIIFVSKNNADSTWRQIVYSISDILPYAFFWDDSSENVPDPTPLIPVMDVTFTIDLPPSLLGAPRTSMEYFRILKHPQSDLRIRAGLQPDVCFVLVYKSSGMRDFYSDSRWSVSLFYTSEDHPVDARPGHTCTIPMYDPVLSTTGRFPYICAPLMAASWNVICWVDQIDLPASRVRLRSQKERVLKLAILYGFDQSIGHGSQSR